MKGERNKTMSKFNHYAKKLDSIAKQAFEDYHGAKLALKSAEKAVSDTPEYHVGMSSKYNTPSYQMKVLKAQEDLITAKENFRKEQRKLEEHLREFAQMRMELEQEIEREYAMNPADLDGNTMELLKSGILKPSDYAILMDKATDAENFTMMRMIAKYAKDAEAENSKRNGANDAGSVLLRRIMNDSLYSDGSNYLEAFDTMTDIYSRATRNDALMDYWEGFTAETVESF